MSRETPAERARKEPDRTAPRRGPRRPDAQANRVALLDAAATVLRRDGEDVTLDAVALEARVGTATLYRRFGGRDELFGEVAARARTIVVGLARVAEESPVPPLDALAEFLIGLVDARERLPRSVLGGSGRTVWARNPSGRAVGRSLDVVLARGVADGSIRPDVDSTDIIAVAAMLARVPATAGHAAAHRVVEILLDGLRSRSSTTSQPTELTARSPGDRGRWL